MRYRDQIANVLRSWKQIQRRGKAFKKRQKQLQKKIDKANRPRDKQGRVIKRNVWGDEVVRVKNKWMLRSDVSDS